MWVPVGVRPRRRACARTAAWPALRRQGHRRARGASPSPAARPLTRSRISPASTKPALEYSASFVTGSGLRCGVEEVTRRDPRPRPAYQHPEELLAWIAQPGGMTKQIADGGPAIAAPIRIPAGDRVLESQAPLLDEPKRKRGGRDIRDLVERQRRPGGHSPPRLEHRISSRRAPHTPVGKHDRRRSARNARILRPCAGTPRPGSAPRAASTADPTPRQPACSRSHHIHPRGATQPPSTRERHETQRSTADRPRRTGGEPWCGGPDRRAYRGAFSCAGPGGRPPRWRDPHRCSATPIASPARSSAALEAQVAPVAHALRA